MTGSRWRITGRGSESVILVYDNIAGAIAAGSGVKDDTKPLPAAEAWELDASSGLFEIESLGFVGNELWFGTNGPSATGNIYKIDSSVIK